MALEEVTDPKLLEMLHQKMNAPNNSIDSDLEEVTDPVLLKQLHYATNPSISKNAIGKKAYEENEFFSPAQQVLYSYASAPLKVGTDVITGLNEFAGNIPGYYQSAKSELSGLPQTLKEHPGSLGKQAFAGSQELINKLAQMPLDISRYGSERLQITPQFITEALKKITPENTTSAINELFGSPQYPGEAIVRGGIRDIPELIGAGKIASIINPMKYTDKAITKNILKAREQNEKIYNKKYNQLFNETKSMGFDDALNNVDIDMKTLKKYTPAKKIVAVEEFNQNPTIKNAHAAKSDLLKLQRKAEEKDFLNKGEKNQYKAISDAIKSLQENMFIDESGKINVPYATKYNQIQQGYATDVVPYKNKPIGKYKRQELSEKQLVQALRNGPFAVKKGKVHPELINQALGKWALLGGGLGSGLTFGGKLLYNKYKDQNKY